MTLAGMLRALNFQMKIQKREELRIEPELGQDTPLPRPVPPRLTRAAQEIRVSLWRQVSPGANLPWVT